MSKWVVALILFLALIVIIFVLFSRFQNISEAPSYNVEETPSNQEEPEQELESESLTAIKYMEEMGGRLELPVAGATGWAAISLPVRSAPSSDAQTLYRLEPGDGFTILEERYDAWWNVILPNDIEGWVAHRYCFINLPDVVPSIVFDITNSYSSLKRSSGVDIPNVSGEALYYAFGFNERLNREEFIVPTLYVMSFRIAQAQQLALADGNTLVIYEVFRPYNTQRLVVNNLQSLVNTNETVAAAFTYEWDLSWFIATGLSNHQRGAAVDLSLAWISEQVIEIAGDYSFIRIVEYIEFQMPSAMHELSPLAVIFANPIPANFPGWRNERLADNATEGARLLMQYMGDVGFMPLPSEWWHFNDQDAVAVAREVGINGRFFIDNAYSVPPNAVLSSSS